jgi:hypothetical protein
MRAILYTVVLLVSLFSCKSVSKMVEKGEYDKAFNYAIKKLEGERNKKTEYVKALEKAYFKLQSASLRDIERYNASEKPENWSKVLNVFNTMESRQNRLDALIPLVSEDGYVGSFEIKNYRNEIAKAEDNTCHYYYNNASSLIDRSENLKDKLLARQAYDELKKIERFKSNYRDSELLKEKALRLGLTKIHVEIYNDLRDFHSNDVERELSDLPLSRLDDLWNDFSFANSKESPDYIVVLELRDIFFSPERERVNTYSDATEILVRKEKVKEKRDTSFVWVEKEVFEKIRADVTEVFREKQSELKGNIRIIDHRTNESINNIPVNVLHNFKGYGCKFIGDERALTQESKNRMDGFLEIFPSDFNMADDLSNAFKDVVMNEIKSFRFN